MKCIFDGGRIVESLRGEGRLIDVGVEGRYVVFVGMTGSLQDPPHHAAIVLYVERVKGRLHLGTASGGAAIPNVQEIVAGRFVDQSMPPRVIDGGGSLDGGVNPSVALECARARVKRDDTLGECKTIAIFGSSNAIPNRRMDLRSLRPRY